MSLGGPPQDTGRETSHHLTCGVSTPGLVWGNEKGMLLISDSTFFCELDAEESAVLTHELFFGT